MIMLSTLKTVMHQDYSMYIMYVIIIKMCNINLKDY